MEFKPPYCPWKDCPTNTNPSIRTVSWFKPNGFRQNKSCGPVQRFVCCHCSRGFSTRTFSIDYWTHLSTPYRQLQTMLISGAGIRQTARHFGLAPKVVANRQARIARQSIALHARMMQEFRLNDSLVFDGFESFAYSQYYPNNIHLLATKNSQFVLAMNAAVIRRKGRMTEAQKVRRADLEEQFRAPSDGIYRSSRELLTFGCDRSFASGTIPIRIDTDEKQEYPWALSRSAPYGQWLELGLVVHTRTNSKRSRTFQNPLFAVNYLDRQLRKDLAEHVRETVRFARRIEASLERVTIQLTHHNYFKSFRVNSKDRGMTHAEMAGFSRKEIETHRELMFSERALGWREPLETWQIQVWKRQIRVPVHRSAKLSAHLDTV